jgi:hypothetical protein
VLFLSTLIVAYSALIIQSEIKTKAYFSPLNLYAILVTIHIGLPAILYSIGVELISNSENQSYISNVLIYVFLTLVVLSIVDQFKSKKKNKIKVNYLWRDSSVKKVILVLLIIGVICRLYLISNNSYFQFNRSGNYNLTGNVFLSFIMLFERFPFYALIIISIHHFSSNKKNSSKFSTNAFYALIIFELIYWIPAGRKEEIISTLIYPFIISVILRNKLPSKKKMFLSSIFILLIFPVTRYLRIGFFLLSISGGNITSFTDVISIIPEAINSGREITKEKEDKNSNLNRISLLESMSAATRLANNRGFKYGESYNSIFYSLIPRFLWPEKPKSTSGVEFGQDSGISGENDTSSISVTYLGESYYNFGFFGVFISSIVLLLMNYLYRLAYFRGKLVYLLIFMIALKPYLYIGGELSPYFTGLLKTILMFLPVFYILSHNQVKNFKNIL